MAEDRRGIYERLSVIETKLDILVDDQGLGLPARVATLERAMYWVKGVAAFATALGAAIGAAAGLLLNRMGLL